ncbi:hypothetical protein GOBAR_AA21389 [Gossypium barbadense]|uniref:RNase H type-1 domain-containing protein n=1 Tax=Gossypium barbadense TaxID=3634 RepID=A0A2P5X7H4_GOSBA|nr:hypothetical protein GOBAR_AA21389 [Gossypium barbadense]
MRGNERRFCMQCVTAISRKECGDPLSRDVLGAFSFHLRFRNGGSNGGWVLGFSMKVGGSDIFQVEVRGIYEGLELAWRNWRVVFKHSSSEYNRMVDGFAKAAKGDYN